MRSKLLSIGAEAPDIYIPLSDDEIVLLSQLRGRKRVVLVFYPGDFTPVCTSQLCAFRDSWAQLQEHDALVVGINPGGTAKHKRFSATFGFPFPLLSDNGGKIAKAYACRGWFGMNRRTVYVVDKNGRIAYSARGNPPITEILQVLHSLQDEPYPVAHNGQTFPTHQVTQSPKEV